MDALRKRFGNNAEPKVPKMPVATEKSPVREGIGLAKTPAKAVNKRNSA